MAKGLRRSSSQIFLAGLAVLLSRISGSVLPSTSLQLTLVLETSDGAELAWVPSEGTMTSFNNCSLHYGPLTESVHVQTSMSPDLSHFRLAHLTPLTPYYVYITCMKDSLTYTSNAVHFTPRGLTTEAMPTSSTSMKIILPTTDRTPPEDDKVIVVMSQRHMDDTRKVPRKSPPSTNVILGAVCGVVGFIIINATIIIVMRQYSQRSARRRRVLELQLEQHGGLFYNLEEVLSSHQEDGSSM